MAVGSIDWQDDDAYLDLLESAPKADISYLLVRPPTVPWRLWHFQVPLLQQFVTGRRTIEKNPFWVCYRVTENGTTRIHPRHIEDFPSRVPPVVDRSASLDAGVSPEAHAKGDAAAENASSSGRKR